MDINRMSKEELKELKENLQYNEESKLDNKVIEEGIVPVLGLNGTESIMATRDIDTELSKLDEGYNNASKIYERQFEDIESSSFDRDLELDQLKQTKESLNSLLDDYERDRDSVLERFNMNDLNADEEITDSIDSSDSLEIEE